MASRRRAILRKLILGALTLFGGIALFYAWLLVPYMMADSEYRRLISHRPKTRAQVDRVLGRWPHGPIDRSESDYGRHFAYTGKFEQYSVLGAAIDVVYDESDRVVVILPSYE